MKSSPGRVTELLREARHGNRDAVDELLPLVYAELRRIAASHLKSERSGHTLQPTALVHEAYLEMAGQQNIGWQDRSHFLGIAAYLMRQILVQHARRRLTAKRAGMRVTLDPEVHGKPDEATDVLALHEALEALADKDERLAKVVELRHFGGLTIDECAEVLGVGTATIEREWRTARAWLRKELLGLHTE